MKRLSVRLAAFALAVAVAGPPAWVGLAWANDSDHPLPLPQSMRQACAQEDSVNCYWDARVAGNQHGHSFVVRQFPGSAHMVCVMYERAKDAARWDYCAGDPVLACGVIDGSEFPKQAAYAFRVCWHNTNRGAQWQHVGRYDGHRHVWQLVGPTTVYLTKSGWFETS